MTSIGATICVALGVSMVLGHSDGAAQILQPLAPKAAEQYASDSEEAAHGDPEAAYRLGEAFEAGRLGGLKDPAKALMFYRLAAQQGHQHAADRAAKIEAELRKSESKHEMQQVSP